MDDLQGGGRVTISIVDLHQAGLETLASS